jgi:hypothetical protein
MTVGEILDALRGADPDLPVIVTGAQNRDLSVAQILVCGDIHYPNRELKEKGYAEIQVEED